MTLQSNKLKYILSTFNVLTLSMRRSLPNEHIPLDVKCINHTHASIYDVFYSNIIKYINTFFNIR